jgi:hypothetical protein
MDTTKLVDMRALKVGQKVTLSDVLPGGGTTGVVIGITKGYVSVQIDARLEGEDGAYCVHFDYNGNLSLFYSWTSGSIWWWAGSPCPIPDLKIVGLCA